jgi:release factor glutamine methyltransferase
MDFVAGESVQPIVSRLWSGVSRMGGKNSPFSKLRPRLARYLFGAAVTESVHHHLWDETTLVMRKAVRGYARHGKRFLDLGTGQAGLLAIYCAKLTKAEVVAVDVNQDYIANAKRIAAACGCDAIRFATSDWFSNVDGGFDLIWANIPYVPTRVGMSRSHQRCPRDVWDGGNDGFDHGRRILGDVGPYLNPHGRLLLGVNTAYVPRRIIASAVNEHPELTVHEIVSTWWLPAEVYVIGRSTHRK